MRRIAILSTIVGALVLSCATIAQSAPLPAVVEFNRDVRPILAENCLTCHGPDSNKRKADLRLDTRDGLFAPIKNRRPVVPGKPDASELFRRVTSNDADERMPEPKSGRRLSEQQIEVLRKWIEQGAPWQGHWSFTAPKRPDLPAVKDSSWPLTPIDRFVLARLEAEGLTPARQADKPTLIRRLTLDLTGVPPTLGEIDDFLSDASPNAYEKVVDRLLKNPHFGERMALDWLDAARYADTHGYHIDSGRDLTRWREWVINAFNDDKPFDQFTVEQLAGDLLPNTTLDQRIATGFNRNSMINFEGGAIPEEYLTAYLIDRVNTTSTVFLGLTIGCCQCHDHKFDPFTQKDYYQLYAFFNGIAENGLDGQKGNAVPVLKTPTSEQQKKLDELATAAKQIEEQLAAPMPQADAAQQEWEKAVAQPTTWSTPHPAGLKSEGGATLSVQEDGSIVVTGANPPQDSYTIELSSDLPQITAIRLEALPDDALAAHGPGRSENGNFVLTHVRVTGGAGAEHQNPLMIKEAWADFSQDNFPVAAAIGSDRKSGWAIYPQVGKTHEAVFEFDHPIKGDDARSLTVTLEFRSQFSQHQVGRFRLSTTSAASPRGSGSFPPNITSILATAADQRSDSQKAELRSFYRAGYVPEVHDLGEQLAKINKDREKIEAKAPTTMVMQEMAKPRDTFILLRGQYDHHGQKVTADVPASLPPLPPGAPHNRLGLAQWLVDPGHPLTARVTVNRLWQTFFGAGIVKTAEDFGTQGEPPSHPELLDWLAIQFRDGDGTTPPWDVKSMVRLIVTSATYRQSSVLNPEQAARDPENRLLARGPRFRLPAEFIRDQALAVSGLLDDRIGGASVYPYQPAGLWSELMSRSDGANWTAQVFVQSHGKDLYRRSMYTFWKRTSPPPTLTTFDAPDRETCTVRRSRTNTPLQALILWNDPTYVEASRKLAERIMTEGGASTDERIIFAFRTVTARSPSSAEAAVLRRTYEKQLAKFDQDNVAAEKLLKVGESPCDPKLNTPELAAWTMVSSVILNLDETVTKS